MQKLKALTNYFTKAELVLWSLSVLFILVSHLIFDRGSYMILGTSLIGATSLIFCAKGNPLGQVLMIIFGALYGIISYTFAYFGEMITYLGMTVPMAIVALVSWLRNPYKGKRSEVAVNHLKAGDFVLVFLLSVPVTAIFYFILKYLGTANLLPSTISVATSFIAVCLTARRSPYFALAYAANDVVLIVLWILATLRDVSYLSVVICFVMFLANDLYGFVNWMKMQKRQLS